ncbi:hypothetical protein AB6A40_000667 [Gnathostoma spinigerum]|uniref:Uncharacterized protein n=1 Tax=Gnathostoma spinigerum TaxID=75299 RepID=A0ABD6E2I3_9BILA
MAMNIVISVGNFAHNITFDVISAFELRMRKVAIFSDEFEFSGTMSVVGYVPKEIPIITLDTSPNDKKFNETRTKKKPEIISTTVTSRTVNCTLNGTNIRKANTQNVGR